MSITQDIRKREDGRPRGPAGARILLIGGDFATRNPIFGAFQMVGYSLNHETDREVGLERIDTEHPTAILLDLGTLDSDGWEFLERVRGTTRAPMVVLTTRGCESDKVRGLRAGADDIVTKPFGIGELVARVGALLRRSAAEFNDHAVFDDGRIRVNFAARLVVANGCTVHLTITETRLVAALVRNGGVTLSPRQLLEMAWGDRSGTGIGRVKFTVLSVRKKLGWIDPSCSLIENVRGFGYRYRLPV